MPPKPQICTCCGQPIIPKIALPPIKQRIYDALKNRPRTSDELRDVAGGYFTTGGPQSQSVIYKHIAQLNEYLKSHGLIVRQPVRYGWYRLEAL